MENRTISPKEQGIDPRNALLSKRTKHLIQTNIDEYTLTVDTCLTFGANAALIGLSDTTGAADLWAKRVDEKDVRESYHEDMWFLEFVSHASSAKRLGFEAEITDSTRTFIQEKVNKLAERQLVDIQNSGLPEWQFITDAKLLGFDVNVSESSDRVQRTLASKDRFIKENYEQRWKKNERDDLRAHYVPFGGIAASLAQARILGIPASPSEFMVKMIEKTIKMAEKEDAIIFVPQLAADLAIIKAKEVNVGGPRGLELVF